jgi:hypothetical protein
LSSSRRSSRSRWLQAPRSARQRLDHLPPWCAARAPVLRIFLARAALRAIGRVFFAAAVCGRVSGPPASRASGLPIPAQFSFELGFGNGGSITKPSASVIFPAADTTRGVPTIGAIAINRPCTSSTVNPTLGVVLR